MRPARASQMDKLFGCCLGGRTTICHYYFLYASTDLASVAVYRSRGGSLPLEKNLGQSWPHATVTFSRGIAFCLVYLSPALPPYIENSRNPEPPGSPIQASPKPSSPKQKFIEPQVC